MPHLLPAMQLKEYLSDITSLLLCDALSLAQDPAYNNVCPNYIKSLTFHEALCPLMAYLKAAGR